MRQVFALLEVKKWKTIRLSGQKWVARGSKYRALTYLVFWIGGRTWKMIGCM